MRKAGGGKRHPDESGALERHYGPRGQFPPNHPYGGGDDPAHRLPGSPKLRVLYDVYHMQLNEGSLCDNIRAYGDQFGHIHIADAPGRHEPGTGEIQYTRVLSCLEETGYTGLVGFELILKTTTAEAVKVIMKL